MNNSNRSPTVSLVVITYNNAGTLFACLESIRNQDYPRQLLELINIDGGSMDKTLDLIKSFGFKTVNSPSGGAESRRARALQEANNEIVAYIDADNVLPSPNWLREMVLPFQEDKEIICSQTLHYQYRPDETLINRYCALFGAGDPVAYYVGHPDRLPHFKMKWTLGSKIEERPTYFKVRFSKENLPTVGANGVLIRKDILLKNAETSPEHFFHIDIFVDLIEKGFDSFAIVKNDVLHLISPTLRRLIKKRVDFLSYYFDSDISRRYRIYNPRKIKDNLRLLLFVLYSITFLKPLFDGFRGYLKIRDNAWFFHPVACFSFTMAYSYVVIEKFFTGSLFNNGKRNFVQCFICKSSLYYLCYARDLHYRTTKDKFDIYKCPKCGLEQIFPLPNKGEIKTFYPAHYYSYNRKSAPKNFFIKLREKIIQIQRVKNPKKSPYYYLALLLRNYFFGFPHAAAEKKLFLDIGCGDGYDVELMSKYGWECRGFELGEKKLENSIYYGNSLEEADFSEKFDFIRIWHILEHVENPDAFLRKIEGLLSEEGKVAIAIPNTKGLYRFLFGKYWYGLDAPRHLFNYNRRNLSILLKKNGLKIVKTHHQLATGLLGSLQHMINNATSLNLNLVGNWFLFTLFAPADILCGLFKISDCIAVEAERISPSNAK